MAEKTLEIGIIGLGKFGLRMATTLASMGHTVIGIDMSDARVQLAEELLIVPLPVYSAVHTQSIRSRVTPCLSGSATMYWPVTEPVPSWPFRHTTVATMHSPNISTCRLSR